MLCWCDDRNLGMRDECGYLMKVFGRILYEELINSICIFYSLFRVMWNIYGVKVCGMFCCFMFIMF